MEPQPHIERGFIEHTVKWVLALPVQIRREVVASRDQAHLNHQAQRGEPRGDHSSDPVVWDEIACHIEDEGHTLAN